MGGALGLGDELETIELATTRDDEAADDDEGRGTRLLDICTNKEDTATLVELVPVDD